MFDSSKCLKAEAFLVSTATRAKKKKKKVFRSISDLQRRSESSLPRSYPHVFPSKYPTSEISAAHLYTVHIFSASPRGAGRRRTRSAAVPSRSRPPAPASRLWAADRCCALPSSASTGGPSVAAALSVCVNRRGGSPLPAADFPFV